VILRLSGDICETSLTRENLFNCGIPKNSNFEKLRKIEKGSFLIFPAEFNKIRTFRLTHGIEKAT
jgi:hypothetical protein